MNRVARSAGPEHEEVEGMTHRACLVFLATGLVLGISPATVKRDWLYARAWLLTHMKGA